MKKIILSLAVAAVTFTGAIAQTTVSKSATTKGAATRETPESKAKESVAKLTAEVGLKADQVTAATKIFTDFYTKIGSLRQQKGTLDEKALDAKKKELKQARNTSLKTVLTTEQWTKFQQANKENRDTNKAQRDEKKSQKSSK